MGKIKQAFNNIKEVLQIHCPDALYELLEKNELREIEEALDEKDILSFHNHVLGDKDGNN